MEKRSDRLRELHSVLLSTEYRSISKSTERLLKHQDETDCSLRDLLKLRKASKWQIHRIRKAWNAHRITVKNDRPRLLRSQSESALVDFVQDCSASSTIVRQRDLTKKVWNVFMIVYG